MKMVVTRHGVQRPVKNGKSLESGCGHRHGREPIIDLYTTLQRKRKELNK